MSYNYNTAMAKFGVLKSSNNKLRNRININYAEFPNRTKQIK